MRNIFVLVLLLCCGSTAWSAVRYIWKFDNYYGRHDCAEVTPGGGFIRWVNADICRRAVGVKYIWKFDNYYGRHECAEVTPGGGFIRWVNSNICRNSGPGDGPGDRPDEPREPTGPAWTFNVIEHREGGKIFVAQILNGEKQALAIQCSEQDARLRLSLNLSQESLDDFAILAKAASEGKDIIGQILVDRHDADPLDVWTVDAENKTLRSHNVLSPLLIEKLKKGGGARLNLGIVTTSFEKRMAFGLRGSQKALTELTKHCVQ